MSTSSTSSTSSASTTAAAYASTLKNYSSSHSSSAISGMISGLDTESIVKQLVNAEKYKSNAVYQQHSLATWKKDAYQDVVSALKDFRSTYLSALSSDSNMLSASSYQAFDVANDNALYLGVSAGNGAKTGTYSISISQLAKAAGSSSSDYTDPATGKAYHISTGNSGLASTYTTLKTLAYGVTDKKGVTTPSPLATPLKLTKLGTKEQVITDDQGNTVTDSKGKPMTRTVDNYKMLFSVNGVDFEFDQDTTLQTVMDTVNASTKANVKMSYSQLTDSISFSSKTTGTGQTVTLGAYGATSGKTTDSEGNTITAQNLSEQNFFASSAGGSAFGIATGSYSNGQNAKAVINGVAVERSSNNFAIDGVAYSLNGITPTDKTLTFNVSANADNAVKKIETFVNAYNTMIGKLQGLYKEKSYATTYPPLTADQKAAMSADDIKNWESFAKSGMLSYDSNLGSLIDSLRDAVSTSVSPYGKSLADFGISTGDYSAGGTLTIDSTKLKQALTSDPDTVIAVFTRAADSLSGKNAAYGNTGVMNRINDALNSYVNTTEDTSIKTQTDLIDDYSKKYTELLDELSDKENGWWTKYTNLESSLSKLQTQMASITNYFTNK